MKSDNLDRMVRGWFVGGFEPSVFKTEACEVAVQRFKAGTVEKTHMHKVATEITLILEGRARMCGQEWLAGDIVRIEPGEATNFHALTDVTTVVVKCPGTPNDKYFV